MGALFAELSSIYAGDPQPEPLLSAFQHLVMRRSIPEERKGGEKKR